MAEALLPTQSPSQNGAYILRKLADALPLNADNQINDLRITCVEVWNGNLYVGTSAAEVLHFVLLPPEPDDVSGQPTAIIASRLEPAFSHATDAGVQQILLLPQVNKACIRCNNTLSFYTLPELSPDSTSGSFPCSWIGGQDLNAAHEPGEDGAVVMIGLKRRVRILKITEHAAPKSIRTIEYGGCVASVRRDNFSCTADARSYALLDIDHQQKIGLFPISSVDPDATIAGGAAEDLTAVLQVPPGNASPANTQPRGLQGDQQGPSRSTTSGVFGDQRPPRTTSTSPRPSSQQLGFDVPESLVRAISPARSPAQDVLPEHISSLVQSDGTDKPLPPPPVLEEVATRSEESPTVPFKALHPHIASPTSTEFLLTVGTTPAEPGVGMFVNLDGDMCRGSISFYSYPDAIVVDGSGIDMSNSEAPSLDAQEGYVLAVVHDENENVNSYGVEMQRWDVDPSANESTADWLDLRCLGSILDGGKGFIESPIGLHKVVQTTDLVVPEIGSKLIVTRLRLDLETRSAITTTDVKKSQVMDKADAEFAQRLSKLQAQIVLWTGSQIWWTVRNPLVNRLDARLDQASRVTFEGITRTKPLRSLIEIVLGDIRGQEPRDEAEYLSLIYIRQKASLLLFIDLVLKSKDGIPIPESEKRVTEQSLIDGELDPRVILTLLPLLHEDVVLGPDGIQIPGGITALVEQYCDESALDTTPHISKPHDESLLLVIKRYLQFWRKRKGLASVVNDVFVFQTIDAALLHVLLLLDRTSPKGPAGVNSVRAELNELVDSDIDCFERAMQLLEQYKRLYVLSRLYHGKRLKSEVLATWRRMLEGDADEGGEFIDGENDMRRYLIALRDQPLVEEYGSWLAARNPKLGVQVFADAHSKVRFEPSYAVAVLKEKAPAAVKYYLEYLVFDLKQTQYVNELIAFYLDIVIEELGNNQSSRQSLLTTYETYRILRSSRPTYHQFIVDNALDKEWWQARLRLLQLLGSGQAVTSSYDVPLILARLQPYEQELVPEMIILCGRQGHHEEALRLLVHGLGDFDTAISYCLYGGSSIFRPSDSGYVPQSDIPTHAEQSRLFGYLLAQLLLLDDISQRIELTGTLLERFGGWFDVEMVLSLIPDEWNVNFCSGFLIQALRKLVRDKAESQIVRALSDAQNSEMSNELVEKREQIGHQLERAT